MSILHKHIHFSCIGLISGLEQAMHDRACNKVVPSDVAHKMLSKMYQWNDVAKRVEKVYSLIMDEPVDSLSCRLKKYYFMSHLLNYCTHLCSLLWICYNLQKFKIVL